MGLGGLRNHFKIHFVIASLKADPYILHINIPFQDVVLLLVSYHPIDIHLRWIIFYPSISSSTRIYR